MAGESQPTEPDGRGEQPAGTESCGPERSAAWIGASRNQLVAAIAHWQAAEFGKALSEGKINRVLDAIDALGVCLRPAHRELILTPEEQAEVEEVLNYANEHGHMPP